MNCERRTFRAELRVTGTDGNPVLHGYAAVFNRLSDDLGGFREKIAPGAFAETIKIHDILALWNHENDLVLGRTKSGTLILREDESGLAFRVTPPDTSWLKDRLVSVKRGDVTGASFGFHTDADEWGTEPDGTRVRTLKKVTLVEVSPGVTFPAYPDASIEVARRSLQRWLGTRGDWQMESRRRRLRLMQHRLRL